jgi:non-lysosomal glucosylceramidase
MRKCFIVMIMIFVGVGSVWSAEPWPVLKHYDREHIARIAMPLGGIGTGTVSIGGRGDLRDWSIMNRPGVGFEPHGNYQRAPFFALYVMGDSGKAIVRAIEGPLDLSLYEGRSGSSSSNHGLPRFRECTFDVAYPLAQVNLSDAEVPVRVRIKAFNPLIPTDANASGIPLAVLKYELMNTTNEAMSVSVCGSLMNFIGMDGWERRRDWSGDFLPAGGSKNRNSFRKSPDAQGIFMHTEGVDKKAATWGTIGLATLAKEGVTYRTNWARGGWGSSSLEFWDDLSDDGNLKNPGPFNEDTPWASVCVSTELAGRQTKEIVFLITWHFPNRYTWTPKGDDSDIIGNYYATQYKDAWDVIEKTLPELDKLETDTVEFVRAFCESDLPDVVKEAALFNVSTLRTQTCFRQADGLFFGWEGTHDCGGCCHGSCTHVWNYEQTTAFLFGELAMKMREVEFKYATGENGLMSFRVNLPVERAQQFGKAAADGQMGCIMKMYRDWQLSGDDEKLKGLWPNVKKALSFCWIKGGWDADVDGVMEGCQHNTMDVEYYGPNPQMGIWYLGALRAGEEMAKHVGDDSFAKKCQRLFENGSEWLDDNLFNGEYYEHKIVPPKSAEDVAPSLRVGMGSEGLAKPDYQLGKGCLVDQLVGQYTAHVCGLGYLTKAENVRTTLKSIMKYNYQDSLYSHFNSQRSYALGDESALLMASYPKERPKTPFPYFTEVMTGFEYAAAVGMLFEGQTENGLKCIKNIRDRYDGYKRNPFDEAECGHNYARAMAAWSSVLALTGFNYSAVEDSMSFLPREGKFFWSNGYSYGTVIQKFSSGSANIELNIIRGTLELKTFSLKGFGQEAFAPAATIETGKSISFKVEKED